MRGWLRRRHRELDERVRQAQAEKELSERRLAAMRRTTTGPLMRSGEQNQFAEMIARSLARKERPAY